MRLLMRHQSCELCNGKYVIALAQIANTEIITFIDTLVFIFLLVLFFKVLFVSRKDNRNC